MSHTSCANAVIFVRGCVKSHVTVSAMGNPARLAGGIKIHHMKDFCYLLEKMYRAGLPKCRRILLSCFEKFPLILKLLPCPTGYRNFYTKSKQNIAALRQPLPVQLIKGDMHSFHMRYISMICYMRLQSYGVHTPLYNFCLVCANPKWKG